MSKLGSLIAYWRSRAFDLPGPIEMHFTIGKHGPSVTFRKDRKRKS
jgi:hypothetical protein